MRPPKKAMYPKKQLGFFQLNTQRLSDIEGICQQLYDTGFTSLKIFFRNPWGLRDKDAVDELGNVLGNGNPFGPHIYDYDKRKFCLRSDYPEKRLNKLKKQGWSILTTPSGHILNGDFYTQTEELIRLLFYYRLGFHVCLYDQYGDLNWKDSLKFNHHWQRNNDLGVSLSAKQLYNSWDKSGTAITDFNTVVWTAKDVDPTSIYKLRPIGEAMVAADKMLFSIIKKWQNKWPKSKVYYNLFNEEHGIGGETKLKAYWYEQVIKPCGFVSKNIEEYVNALSLSTPSYISGSNFGFGWNLDFNAMKSMLKYLNLETPKKRFNSAHLEIHSIECQKVIDYLKAKGLNDANILWDTDGLDEKKNIDGKDPLQRQVEVFHSSVRRVSLKFTAGKKYEVINKFWFPNNMRRSFDKLGKILFTAIKKG